MNAERAIVLSALSAAGQYANGFVGIGSGQQPAPIVDVGKDVHMQVVDGFADPHGAADDYLSCTNNFPCFTTLVLQSQISIRKLGYLMGIGIPKLQPNAIDMHVAI
jgi:hypothetical protein